MLSLSLAGSMVLRSERAQGEMPQHQLLVAAALAHALERRVDEQLELRVFAVDGDGHPVAEILGFAERPALELAARLGCFFSSRRRHTRLQGDWSSDVCSSG